MKILFTCGREPEYVRNEIILRALRKRYEITEITDNQGGSLIARSLRLIPRLVPQIIKGNYDVIFVGFYGYLLVPWLRRLTRRPIIFDAFVSNYDTLCFDRQYFHPNSIRGKIAFELDRLAYANATIILTDTLANQAYFAQTFNLPAKKLAFLYVSCNEDLFYPQPSTPTNPQFNILSYSSYLPLHGIENIIYAAKQLENEMDIEFRLIGHGLTYNKIKQLIKDLDLHNVQLMPPIPYAELPKEIAQANVCLAGPFGSTNKAKGVIPTKLFQFLAMGQPTIAGDTPANQELLIHKHNAFLVPVDQKESLAEAILELKQNNYLSRHLSHMAYESYQQLASETIISQKLYQIIENSR